MIIQGLWDCKFNAIIDVKLGDAGAESYKYEPMKALLDGCKTIKKDKHGKHCNDEQKKIGRLFSQWK